MTGVKRINYLSEQQYIQLSEICDKIIANNLSEESVIAQDFLHVPRMTPLTSRPYMELYASKVPYFLLHVIHIVRNVTFFFIEILKSLFYQPTNFSGLDKRVDYLIVSHYLGCENGQKYVDSYFGKILENIKDGNLVSANVVYIDHDRYTGLFTKNSRQKDLALLSDSIGLLDLLKIYWKSVVSLVRFSGLKSDPVAKRISNKVRIGLFSPGTIRCLILSHHIERTVTELLPKCLMTTYEGHSWERLCFSSARSVKRDVKCVAYQHAPVFKYQHAIQRDIGQRYDPDIILTSGPLSKEYLSKCAGLKRTRVALLGSGRWLPINNNGYKHKQSLPIETCLVAPEGTLSECLILFGFSLECAKRFHNIRFLWRFPAQVNIRMLQKANSAFQNLSDNIFISNSDLENDIKLSQCILYRGSSVVIQATLSGLLPVYLSQEGELSIDPLFSYKEDNRSVIDCSDFEDKIMSAASVPEDLIQHCQNMYTEVNVSVLEHYRNEID